MDTIDFTQMKDGTRAEYQLLGTLCDAHIQANLADGVLSLLKAMEGPMLGYKIDRYQHSLQTATRAQAEGADEETVVCALLHDIGDSIAPENHSAVAAAILRPYISEKNHWIVAHHGVFQGYYFFHHIGRNRDARERYREHVHFQACAAFCENWDQNSFDPNYETAPLSAFEPAVRRLFARSPQAFG